MSFLVEVLRNKGVYENVKFVQQENFWIGPSSVSPFSILLKVTRLAFKNLIDKVCFLLLVSPPGGTNPSWSQVLALYAAGPRSSHADPAKTKS